MLALPGGHRLQPERLEQQFAPPPFGVIRVFVFLLPDFAGSILQYMCLLLRGSVRLLPLTAGAALLGAADTGNSPMRMPVAVATYIAWLLRIACTLPDPLRSVLFAM